MADIPQQRIGGIVAPRSLRVHRSLEKDFKIGGHLARYELAQNHAQRIDVRIDANPLAAQLFWSGIGGSHDTQTSHRLVGAVIQLFRDSEIEQLHNAFFGDKNVGGLEIAMDDSMLVGVLHGFEYLEQQAQALLGRQSFALTVFGKRNSFHIFHRKPGRPVR